MAVQPVFFYITCKAAQQNEEPSAVFFDYGFSLKIVSVFSRLNLKFSMGQNNVMKIYNVMD